MKFKYLDGQSYLMRAGAVITSCEIFRVEGKINITKETYREFIHADESVLLDFLCVYIIVS